MRTNQTRLAVVAGATLALVVASTAAVAAAPGHGRDRGFGPDDDQMWPDVGMGMLDGRGILRGGMFRGLGVADDLERYEITAQTADGTTVQRVEQGTVDSASDSSLVFSLASGESVTVSVDEDTAAYGLSEEDVTSRRGVARSRLVPSEVAVADIAAGSEVVVWSGSEDGADFSAQRIIVQPTAADDTAADDAAHAGATDDSTSDDAASDSAVTDDAAASPLANDA